MLLFGGLSDAILSSIATQAGSLTNQKALDSLLGIMERLPTQALSPGDWQNLMAVGLFLMTPLQRAHEANQPNLFLENNPRRQIGRDLSI